MLQSGELVALPTETVYGLGGNALMSSAIKKIYAVKTRPASNPLIIHVNDIAAVKNDVIMNEAAEKIISAFWPGPLTIVLQRSVNCNICAEASAGTGTVALRSPLHPVARALLAESGVPLAAPSANMSGCTSPTKAEHVEQSLGKTITIIDGGDCDVGIESTVIDLSGNTPLLLRPGSITAEIIEQKTGIIVMEIDSAPKHSPGMLDKHYAPALPVRLNATDVKTGEALLAFGSNVPEGAETTLNLSESGNLDEAAHNLFAFLRQLDSGKHHAIAVMPIAETGIGKAINDRLRRAAAK